jgi:hypothetical protein
MSLQLTPLERAWLQAEEMGRLAEANELRRRVDQVQADKETELSAQGAIFRAAQWYAATLGIPVFPCAPLQKRPATDHGLKDATRDQNTIREWWTMWPKANVAFPTGILFDVIDIDGPQGVISLGELRASGHLPPVMASAMTPRGFHYYIRPTGDRNTTNVRPGIDYRGKGGYVLAPPSWFGGEPAGPKSPAKPAGWYRWSDPLTPAKITESLR